MQAEGNILKMKNQLSESGLAEYQLPIGDDLLPMNQFVGKKIRLSFDGVINCIATGEKIKKSYQNGYSFPATQKLPECDICIVKPELCHFDKGTCRDESWGQKHCFQPHVVYLAVSSGLKVGITRQVNVPHRWIDQGAIKALPILKVENRLMSGLIEIEIAKNYKDKTNWRKMLKGEIEEEVDLFYMRDQIYEEFGDLLDEYDAEDLDEELVEISYPVESLPDKIKSLGFDKTPEIEGTLMGIKGQYLILDTGVLNMRKHQGYYINIKA